MRPRKKPIENNEQGRQQQAEGCCIRPGL